MMVVVVDRGPVRAHLCKCALAMLRCTARRYAMLCCAAKLCCAEPCCAVLSYVLELELVLVLVLVLVLCVCVLLGSVRFVCVDLGWAGLG